MIETERRREREREREMFHGTSGIPKSEENYGNGISFLNTSIGVGNSIRSTKHFTAKIEGLFTVSEIDCLNCRRKRQNCFKNISPRLSSPKSPKIFYQPLLKVSCITFLVFLSFDFVCRRTLFLHHQILFVEL